MISRPQFDGIVFYSTEDAALAEPLVAALRNIGLNLWFYPERVAHGSITLTIADAFRKSTVALLCFGTNGMGLYQSHEYSAAYTRFATGGITLIPVYLGTANRNSPSNPPNDDAFLADLRGYDLRFTIEESAEVAKLAEA